MELQGPGKVLVVGALRNRKELGLVHKPCLLNLDLGLQIQLCSLPNPPNDSSAGQLSLLLNQKYTEQRMESGDSSNRSFGKQVNKWNLLSKNQERQLFSSSRKAEIYPKIYHRTPKASNGSTRYH